MNKSIKTLAFALLTMSLLAACTPRNDNKSSSGNSSGNSSPASSESSDSSSSSSVDPVTVGWTDEEKAIMADHLYGIVLPYIDKDGMTVSYDNASGIVSIEGATVEGNELLDYEALFTEERGYTDITSEYTSITDGSFKAFCKSASTSQGMRYIDIVMYALDDSSDYALEGDLYISASDPYIYEFPDLAPVFAKYPLLTPFEVPTFTVTNGYFYGAEGENNELAYEYGMYDYMNFLIIGYHATAADFAAFEAKFSSWEVTDEGGYYSAKKEVVTDYLASVLFMYTPAKETITYQVNLGLEEKPVTDWPAAEVAALIQTLAPGSTTVVPALEGGTSYEWYYSTELDVYGDSSLKTTYISILTTALWTAGSEEDTYISPAQDIMIDLYYNSYYECLEITFSGYSAPSATWPAEQIAALLGAGVTDVLPAFEGTATSYQVLNDMYGTAVVVSVASGTEDAAIESYNATLATALYTASFGYQVSPNGQIAVTDVYMGTSGSFTISFEAVSVLAAFPMAEINSYLTTYGLGFTFTSPLVDSTGKGFMVTYSYNGSYHGCRIEVNGNQVEAFNTAITAILPDYYLVDTDTATRKIYYEETYYHEIDIIYNSTRDITYINLWE